VRETRTLLLLYLLLMAITKLDIEAFIQLAPQAVVLDVRSPGEYNHAHIPGAISLPLFTDEERKVVGTAYKQQNRETAIKIGLDFFGPKMRGIVEKTEALCAAKKIVGENTEVKVQIPVLIHCWRGGMRSGGIAWLLDLYGFKVYTLAGGYKRFRNYVLASFNLPINYNVLGGYTGSGKTKVLHELNKKGKRVIDLEGLANHKGSAFGAIGQPECPSQEMFENLLATAIRKFADNEEPVWIEDESQRIGPLNLPHGFWNALKMSPVYFLDIPFEKRLSQLECEYGKLEKEKMVNAIMRIQKRLGGLETKTAINFLLEG
jgi:tRNA 2-selenouridine synthase